MARVLHGTGAPKTWDQQHAMAHYGNKEYGWQGHVSTHNWQMLRSQTKERKHVPGPAQAAHSSWTREPLEAG
eukprot:4706408-Alexandrium_andersonii.AAC.1